MRLTNRQKKPMYDFFNTLFLMIILTCIALYILEKFKFNLLGIEENFLLIIPIMIFVIYYLKGRQVFDYDSDGETLTIKNRFVSFIGYKNANDEFPKYKVVRYNIVNAILFKKLYIVITSKKHEIINLKYDISYLTQKEVKDLKFSLSKIIQNNKKNPTNSDN
jgi:hypothetical protein